ncbi:hypothetical protein [Marispirochaeta sp.]|uniref:hypothetical protein n=1 Tax=Marispirochaeta sp. TaxID=2038653 RepID=UPI0029C677DB|nr:hypothetical protein [Marispirochaeta sp.]
MDEIRAFEYLRHLDRQNYYHPVDFGDLLTDSWEGKEIPWQDVPLYFSREAREALFIEGIRENDQDKLRKALAAAPDTQELIDSVRIFGQSALVYAAVNGQYEVFALLLDQGADYSRVLDDFDNFPLRPADLTSREKAELQHTKNKLVYLIAWHHFYLETGASLDNNPVVNEEMISRLTAERADFDVENFDREMVRLTLYSERVLDLFRRYNILYEQGEPDINAEMFDDFFTLIAAYLGEFEDTADLDLTALIAEVKAGYESQGAFVHKKIFLSQPLYWQLNLFNYDSQTVMKIYELLQTAQQKVLINLNLSDSQQVYLTDREVAVFQEMAVILSGRDITDRERYQSAIINTVELLRHLDQGLYQYINGEELTGERLLRDLMYGITDIGPQYIMDINTQVIRSARTIGSTPIINASLANIALLSPEAAMVYQDYLGEYSQVMGMGDIAFGQNLTGLLSGQTDIASLMSGAGLSYSKQLFMAHDLQGIMGLSNAFTSDADLSAYMYDQCAREMSATIMDRGEEGYCLGGSDPAGLALNTTLDIASCFVDPWTSISVSVITGDSTFEGTVGAVTSAGKLHPAVYTVLTTACVAGAVDNGLQGLAQGNYPTMSEVERQAKINYHAARVDQLNGQIRTIDKDIKDTQGRINQNNNTIQGIKEDPNATQDDKNKQAELEQKNKEERQRLQKLQQEKEKKEKERTDNEQKKRDLEQYDPTTTCPRGPDDEEMTLAQRLQLIQELGSTLQAFIKLGLRVPPWLISAFDGALGRHHIPERDPGCIDWPQGYIPPEKLPPLKIEKPEPQCIDWGQDYIDPELLPQIEIEEPINPAMGPTIGPDGSTIEALLEFRNLYRTEEEN